MTMDGYFQQDNIPCNKAQTISNWLLKYVTVFTWPSQSPDLNPIENLWGVVEQEIHIMGAKPTNLQKMCDAIMSMWTRISEECSQLNVEKVLWRIKAVLKAKRGVQPCISKMYLTKYLMSLYDQIYCKIIAKTTFVHRHRWLIIIFICMVKMIIYELIHCL